MRPYLIFLLTLITNLLFAQQRLKVTMENFFVDSGLRNYLFYVSKNSRINYSTKLVIINKTTWKIDSSTENVPKDFDILVNAHIEDSGRSHFEFDNCASYFKGDTLVVQFQDNSSFEVDPLFVDKLFLYIVKDKFYSVYMPCDSHWWGSPYKSLVIKRQALTLKKMVTAKGERLMGILTILYTDENPKSKVKLLNLTGPFDCIVQ
jgi:hypothetical protein